jgi:hypothetical protein
VPSPPPPLLPPGSAALLPAPTEVLELLFGAPTDALDTLLSAVADSLNGTLRSLADSLNATLGALTKPFDPSLGALADSLDSSLGALAESLDSSLGAASDSRDSLPGPLAYIRDRGLGPLSCALDYVPRICEQVVRATAHISQCLADALQQLGITVERGQDAPEDPGDVMQPHLHQRLGLDASYVELHLPKPDRHPRIELDEVAGLGKHCEMGPEIVEFELDLVDLGYRRIDVDVDGLFDLIGVYDRIVRKVLIGTPPARRRTGVAGPSTGIAFGACRRSPR